MKRYPWCLKRYIYFKRVQILHNSNIHIISNAKLWSRSWRLHMCTITCFILSTSAEMVVFECKFRTGTDCYFSFTIPAAKQQLACWQIITQPSSKCTYRCRCPSWHCSCSWTLGEGKEVFQHIISVTIYTRIVSWQYIMHGISIYKHLHDNVMQIKTTWVLTLLLLSLSLKQRQSPYQSTAHRFQSQCRPDPPCLWWL